MKLVGIAGGSGSGKSTLAISLCRKYPQICALLHIDDYFKKSEDAPTLAGFTNWDHPDAIRFDDLYRDLLSLKSGNSITILTKSELYNPGFDYTLRNKIEYTIEPKLVIILEGYLALYDERVRSLLDVKVYLDIPIEESTKRRSSNKFALDEKYYAEVLVPMHKQFVEPAKEYANLVIDVSGMTPEEVLERVEPKVYML